LTFEFLFTNIQVRDKNERWIRCALSKGDFVILPPGIYHRFTPAESNFTHAIRLFKDLPEWAAYYRKDGEHLPERAEYLRQMALKEKTNT
jgi:1,2-dihydroxy-3-keto-5-methylthiopentene dioxygenase